MGATFHPFVHAPHHNMRDRGKDLVRDWEARTPLGAFARVADKIFFGPAEAHARDVLDAVARLAPDALAVDLLSIGALAGAERSGVPTAVLFHMPYSVPLEGVTPIGMGFQPVTGDYSHGAAGLWIEGGEIVHAVEEVTIAGNLGEMLASIDAVADDLVWLGRVASPSLRVARMTVAGE